MSKAKTNPRTRPATQADVQRALEAGRMQGMEFMANSILWILLDKHGAPKADLFQLSEEISYHCDSINRGYVSYPEIRRALRDEYEIEVKFK